MGNLDIKPAGDKWTPDFFGDKSISRKKLENDSAVKSLIASKMLLSQPLNKFMYASLTSSAEIENLIQSYTTGFPVSDSNLIVKEAQKILAKRDPKTLTKETVSRAIEEAVKITQNNQRTEAKDRILAITTQLEDSLDAFRKSATSAAGVDILKRVGLYFCKKCNGLICTDTFKSKKCSCGCDIKSSSETDKKDAMVLEDEVKNFIKKNTWLESGVEMLFIKAGYETGCGIYILGTSGVRHEIDLIATRKRDGKRVIGECKTKPISLDIVFKLFGQMSELGCSEGYIFSTDTAESGEVKKLANSKHIRIFEKILETNSAEIDSQL